jgi:hypothetical protein
MVTKYLYNKLLQQAEESRRPVKDSILIGRQEKILAVPAGQWRQHLAQARQHSGTRLNFMTHEHHLVRNAVVRELPRNQGKPLRAEDIARNVALPLSRVLNILAELEQHLFFLVCDAPGEVNWAFPVTCTRTPHRLHFSSGESSFAA